MPFQAGDPDSIALDKQCVDAIREIMGLDPLYAPNGSRRTEAERFYVDTEAATTELRRVNASCVKLRSARGMSGGY